MSFTPLPALRVNDHRARICVRVTRKWEYRGPSDDGSVQHADLVLADYEGNAIYAEIPQHVVQQFSDQIEEDHIYIFSRFRVANNKNFYKPVDGRFMIYLTIHTQIANPTNPPTTFPRHVYKLTPFEELPMLVGNFRNFVDVLGIVVEIGEPHLTTQGTNNQGPALIRKLVLKDASGLEMRMTLWGQRATQFNIDAVYNINEAKPVVALFLGCLVKSFSGQDYLSGSSACKWYFNPEIPEAEDLHISYQNQRIEVRRPAAVPQQMIQPPPPPAQEVKYLKDLQDMDPYDFPENGCLCTVIIARMVPDASWWFASCTRCGKSCSEEGSGYICYSCNNTNYKHKYKLLFVVTDGTAEAQMICFGQLAQRIVGKPVEQVIRTVKRYEDFPPDIAGIISQRYTFGINISNQSYYIKKQNKSFIINSIITYHGRQRAIPQGGTSSSNYQVQRHSGSIPSGSSANIVARRPTSTPPQSTLSPPAEHHQTPSSSPLTIEPLLKDAPVVDPADAPAAKPTRKRLTYYSSEDEQDSDNERRKNTKTARMKATDESAEGQSSLHPTSTRPSPEHRKTIGQKTSEIKTSRSQKNK